MTCYHSIKNAIKVSGRIPNPQVARSSRARGAKKIKKLENRVAIKINLLSTIFSAIFLQVFLHLFSGSVLSANTY